MVVEYKELQLCSADDAREKREIDELWEVRSGGQCLFTMPKGPDFMPFGRNSPESQLTT